MKNILEYKGYYGDVRHCEDSEGYIGKVLEIKALILYEGETIEELETDFRESLEFYFEKCKERNKEPEKPVMPKELVTDSIDVRIPIETKNRITAFAKSSGISINAFIRDSIERRLETMV